MSINSTVYNKEDKAAEWRSPILRLSLVFCSAKRLYLLYEIKIPHLLLSVKKNFRKTVYFVENRSCFAVFALFLLHIKRIWSFTIFIKSNQKTRNERRPEFTEHSVILLPAHLVLNQQRGCRVFMDAVFHQNFISIDKVARQPWKVLPCLPVNVAQEMVAEQRWRQIFPAVCYWRTANRIAKSKDSSPHPLYSLQWPYPQRHKHKPFNLTTTGWSRWVIAA